MSARDRYLDYSGRADRLSGGVRRIPVDTPSGTFTVWTKRVGNNPRLAVLLLHGGPGATHEYLEAFDSYLPAAGIEYYYYDQLGSGFSDQPDEPSLWDLDRFVDEVEQVRAALGLGAGNFVLYGQSWGGILATEYALAHQDQLRGLVISNMMASAPAYTAYAEQVLMPELDPAVVAEIKALEVAGDIENPRYLELGPRAARTRAHQPQDLRSDAGAKRARHERAGQARPLGPGRRPAPHHGADVGHRCQVRHHGPGAHGDDGGPAAPRQLPVLPEREPPGHVRRPGDLLRRGSGREALQLAHAVASSDR
jgi:pimeloyl-ACP methyl ester carboxylesterase